MHKPGVYEMSMPDDDQHTLKLQRVRSLDVGALVVMANNQFGSDLCTIQLALAGNWPSRTDLREVGLLKTKTPNPINIPLFVFILCVSSLVIRVQNLK